MSSNGSLAVMRGGQIWNLVDGQRWESDVVVFLRTLLAPSRLS
jgi:hypothetical protein